MSANAPILKLILERLDSIDSRLTKVESRLIKVEDTVVKLQEYVHNESYIQERKFTTSLQKYISLRFKGAFIKVVNFGKFFLPYDNNPLTDIDGCVLAQIEPMKFKKDGKNITIDMSRTYFIEAKHAVTKTILDKKLKQFVKIIHTIRDVQDGRYIPRRKQFLFDQMIRTHSVDAFPRNIVFLMSTEKMAPDALDMIVAITSGTFSEKQYNDLLFRYISTHPLMNDINEDSSVHEYVKIMLAKASSIADIQTLLHPTSMPSAKKSQPQLHDKTMTLQPYKENILSLMIPFDSYMEIVNELKGKIGFISHDWIQLPEDVIKHGFNSRNALMNLTHNDVKPYNYASI